MKKILAALCLTLAGCTGYPATFTAGVTGGGNGAPAWHAGVSVPVWGGGKSVVPALPKHQGKSPVSLFPKP